MHTKLMMTLSAVFMAALGAAALFLPQEIAARFCTGALPDAYLVLAIQVGGALYLGFAILNWTARGDRIGGIYGRPTALGNFMHFAVAAIVLLKSLAAGSRANEIIAAAAIYSLFAVCFGLVLFVRMGAEN